MFNFIRKLFKKPKYVYKHFDKALRYACFETINKCIVNQELDLLFMDTFLRTGESSLTISNCQYLLDNLEGYRGEIFYLGKTGIKDLRKEKIEIADQTIERIRIAEFKKMCYGNVEFIANGVQQEIIDKPCLIFIKKIEPTYIVF